ncbi:OTU-like cysteine protease [Blumeria hordei DH14]|uniref:Ubiquitin thioesterase OTU n=1 Tax=Blumeria graminis f. sp. hordei (strain DH14) TaxID=546991 RepID=N1JCW5_BLUG1|nr:OTU-like cysteine protease [Blumeria hordei DH14]
MRIRIRGPQGASIASLSDESTVGNLIEIITEKTKINDFEVRYGYPLRTLELFQFDSSLPLFQLSVKLDGEQLIISTRESTRSDENTQADILSPGTTALSNKAEKVTDSTQSTGSKFQGKVDKFTTIKQKEIEGDSPEIPIPERGATLVLRIMPDDNSCLFRAFGSAVIPTDDKTMTELRALIASVIQAERSTYTKVVLEKSPDEYCRWIQSPDAWGGAIELVILANHFDIEVCSIDVQSLRIDRFNEGRPTRCILVYSGVHYDTIAQTPSDPPHTKSQYPPEFDQRVWNSDDNQILDAALELCRKLKAKKYYTDTARLKIKCNVCGIIVYGEQQAAKHAHQFSHFDMAEINTTM